MEFVSLPNAREAERNARAQRLAAARWLRVDESKIAAPKDMMLLHRVRAAASDRSDAFDTMLRDPDVNRLFNEGALYFERPA
jgi:hypothetical protein